MKYVICIGGKKRNSGDENSLKSFLDYLLIGLWKVEVYSEELKAVD